MSSVDASMRGKLSNVKNRLVRLSGRRFVRNVAILASSSSAVSAIGLAVTPFVTRLYGPDAFGVLGVFMSIVGIVTHVAALGYPLAIVLPKDDRDAAGLARLSLGAAGGLCLIILLLILGLDEVLAQKFGLGSLPLAVIYLIPLAAFLNISQKVISQWSVRKLCFEIHAKVAVIQALLLGGAKVVAGLIVPSAMALIVITVTSIFAHTAMLVFGVKLRNAPLNVFQSGKASLLDLAKRHSDFPLYRAPEQVINAVSIGLPVLMLASLFDQASAGFYSLTMSVLGVPIMLIGVSIHNVFYPKLNEAALRNERTFPLIYKTTLGLVVVGAVPYVVVIAFGPALFGFVFGEQWTTSGEYARWLAPWYFFILLIRPSVAALPILSAQRFYLCYSVVAILIRILALFIGYAVFESAYISIALFGGVAVCLNIFLILTVLKFSRHHDINRATEKITE